MDSLKSYCSLVILRMRSQAAAAGDWGRYLEYTQAAWTLAQPNEQAKLTDQAWTIVNSLSGYERDKLAANPNPDIQAWFDLQQAFQGDRIHSVDLMNLQSFHADAIYQQDLLPKLLASQPAASQVRQIAIMLPMQGKYKVVSEQIRNGIVKAYYASNKDIVLKFYDSSELTDLESIYTQAKEEGADRIIGPLRKEAVQALAGFHDSSMLALNSIDSNAITQFSFKSADPAEQMVNRFNLAGYQRIGIMTNDNPRNMAAAQALQNIWQASPDHVAEISVYPDQNPKLRDALGQLIHEDHSKERRNNVRWAVAEKIEYFPRTREDLQAIVILDDARRLAVFRPQFDFFALQTPLYSDSKLTPSQFQDQRPNRDLRDVTFLSYPAVLDPVDLENKFEAFGWDSFLVSTYSEELKNGACLAIGKTGILSQNGAEIEQTQIWVSFNREGLLEKAPLLRQTSILTEELQDNGQ